MKKIKVVWICHFSNEETRKRLPLSDMRIVNIIKLLLGKKIKTNYVDFAPWVTNLIQEFENIEDVVLHVIAPHKGLLKSMHEFEMNGVYYHFFKPDLPILHLSLPAIFNKIVKYYKNRLFVKKFINRIKPDIVNLIGTENPYYSITVLDIEKIPVFVSVQTVYTNPEIKTMIDNFDQFKFDTELKIHRKEKYYGCSGRMYRDLILVNNPDAIIFKHFFPIQKPGKLEEVSTEYDFVFFAAAVTSVKGIEDAVEALSIVKKEIDNVTLNVVGNCSLDYLNMIKEKIKGLGLNDNVSFNGYFPQHADMLQHVKKSRFALLPIKLDVISSTVIEAMLLGIPLVTYKTTGTPYLNKDGETVLLADRGDTSKLAENMLKLLTSPELADKLSKVARAFAEKEFDNTTSAKRLLGNYRAVMEHYYNNRPISEDQLFDLNEFPSY